MGLEMVSETGHRGQVSQLKCQRNKMVFGNRTMCVSCHLDSVEAPWTEGPRMTDETGDIWRRTETVNKTTTP